MPGRTYTAAIGYRYGFNGKEQDNEISGQGNQYDYGFRIYNPRLGRFLSVDPLTKGYPELTPYQFASNTPVQAIDLDGLEQYHYTFTQDAQGKTVLIPMYDGKPQDFEEDKISIGFGGGVFGIFHTYKTIKNPRVEYVVHHEDTKKYYTSPGVLNRETFTYDETRTFSSYEKATEVDESFFAWTVNDAKVKIAADNKYNETFLYAAAARSVNSGQKTGTTNSTNNQSITVNNGNTQAAKNNSNATKATPPSASSYGAFRQGVQAINSIAVNGSVSQNVLRSFVPKNMANSFVPSQRISQGFKYNLTIGGLKVQIKWHSPDSGAPAGSNSATTWTAQIKIGNKYLGSDGQLHSNNQQNKTHIPVNMQQ